ncbi:efflux MFS transporter permease [Celeribacter sp. ULVN23_4]
MSTETTAPTPEQPAPLPIGQALAYMAAATMIAVTQGLAQGFVSANIPAFAGDLGMTTTEASWLMVAFMVPRAALPLLLIKLRTQFGLRRFAEFSILFYMIVAFASLWVTDFRSAVIIQTLSGIAAAPLSTLAFLYMLEPLSQNWKLRLGLPAALTAMMVGTPLSRVISPMLLGDGGLTLMHLCALGLAMIALSLVYLLPLRPTPHAKVIEPIDFLSCALIVFGFAGVMIGFVIGPMYNWHDVTWLGWLLAAAVAALAATAVIELHRSSPIIDVRWIASPAILHLTITLFLFRLILSEQSSTVPRMFLAMGVSAQEMIPLFKVVSIATIMGGLACVAWIKPTRVHWFHLAALVLIMIGAWLDSQSTVMTRPEQLILSQALIGFAGMLFMPTAMMAGLMSALARGPQYILSFVIIFISTQSLGAVVGSGLLSTLATLRAKLHYQTLLDQITLSDPNIVASITTQMKTLATQFPDPVMRKAQIVAGMAQDANQQATVMAYDDVYFAVFLIAACASAALLLHVLRDLMAARHEAIKLSRNPAQARTEPTT